MPANGCGGFSVRRAKGTPIAVVRTRGVVWRLAIVVAAVALALGGLVGPAAARQETPEAVAGACPSDTPGANAGTSGQDCPPAAVPTGEITEQLPPPDMPSANEEGYTFDLGATLTADFDAVPSEAPVYALERPEPTKNDTRALAERLKIDGEVEDRGNGVFVVSGDGQLFVTPDLIQYLSAADLPKGDLPDDEEAITTAREWLRHTELAPPDLGEGTVASRTEESDRIVVLFTPVEPERLLAGYPSITVSLGPEGVVLEAASRWATITQQDLYRLESAEDAWFSVEANQVYIEAELDGSGLPQGAQVEGTVEYTDIDLAYTTAGPPGREQFLTPVFVFTGRLSLDGRKESYPISAYVPALADSGAPVGRLPSASAS